MADEVGPGWRWANVAVAEGGGLWKKQLRSAGTHCVAGPLVKLMQSFPDGQSCAEEQPLPQKVSPEFVTMQ